MGQKSMLVYGVGINDADYVIETREYFFEDGDKKNRMVWRCPFYKAWVAMFRRCYCEKLHSKHPSYQGCYVSTDWQIFSNFKAWMSGQNWQGNHLDKDILKPGNKVYGPDECVFVSGALNNFLTDSAATRGEWPIGVHWHKRDNKFMACIRNPITRKREHLGYFDCPDEAHAAWLKRKRELAHLLADQQTDQRIADALRARYASAEGKA